MTQAKRQPLRVGVLLNSLEVNAWTFRILEDIASSSFCKLELAVIDDRSPPQLSAGQRLAARCREWWERGLFNRYQRWDYERYADEYSAFAKRDASELIPPGKRLRIVPVSGKFTDRFQDEDVGAILEADLDVMLRFGFRILKGDVLKCARYGVWSYHHGDNHEYRGGPALFWEIYERNPVSGSILQVLSEKLDGGHVLYRSWSATNFDSLYRNRNGVYWKSTSFVMRCLRDLHERGWDYLANREDQGGPYDKPIYKAPGNLKMAGLMARRLGSALRNRVGKLLFREYNHWRLIARPAGNWPPAALKRGKEAHLVPPDDRFYADPFIIKRDGRHFVFFEDYRYSQEKGLVSFAELHVDGSFSEPEVVLERDYHLSYPFIFERDGETYMIPETRQANRIELYRAVDFPRKWAFERVLVPNVAAVDSTLHEANGKLWLFCNIAAPGASTCEELHLFSADDLQGQWKPHPCNPVVSDVRRARPAGRLFEHEGALLRPAQDCSLRYGWAINLNRVKVLSETEYQEEPVHRIVPDWLPGNYGTHTLNQDADFTVLDAKFVKRKLRLPQLGAFGRDPLKSHGQNPSPS